MNRAMNSAVVPVDEQAANTISSLESHLLQIMASHIVRSRFATQNSPLTNLSTDHPSHQKQGSRHHHAHRIIKEELRFTTKGHSRAEASE